MKFPRSTQLSIYAAVLSGLIFAAPHANAEPEADAVTFIYIHGFGGIRENPKFCRNMRDFLKAAAPGSKIINYEWDSVAVDPLKPAASWTKSQQRADKEATKFKTDVIDHYETKASPYVLVGFSVGSRVVLRALESCDTELKGLAGVYFLGSAMTKDTTLKDRTALPKGMTITNYHSPLRDKVHAMAFKMFSDIAAGGQDGFDDDTVFENLAVACTHAHKGVGLSIDYSGLAEAIGAIELYQNGIRIPGETSFNLKTPVGEGDIWWNKIMTVRLPGGATVEIEQHNTRPGYYRALQLDPPTKQRHRIARGTNLHAILHQLGVEPGR